MKKPIITSKITEMEEALEWWHNTLTESGRSQFPTPESDEDILEYYKYPADNLCLDYITYMPSL